MTSRGGAQRCDIPGARAGARGITAAPRRRALLPLALRRRSRPLLFKMDRKLLDTRTSGWCCSTHWQADQHRRPAAWATRSAASAELLLNVLTHEDSRHPSLLLRERAIPVFESLRIRGCTPPTVAAIAVLRSGSARVTLWRSRSRLRRHSQIRRWSRHAAGSLTCGVHASHTPDLESPRRHISPVPRSVPG